VGVAASLLTCETRLIMESQKLNTSDKYLGFSTLYWVGTGSGMRMLPFGFCLI
jgi:hypothetical protein